MPEIVCRFEFHPIGQGLFYSGSIDKFNFVYDCGTNSSKRYLSSAIDAYNVSQKLDMLIISHFHKDHISGIKELLQKTTGVKDVIMPYLYPEEIFLLLANYIFESEQTLEALKADDYVQFLQDPIAWFPESVERIIYIRPEKEGKEGDINRRVSNSNDNFSWTNEPHQSNRRLYYQSHHESFKSQYWHFKFYCATSSLATSEAIKDELDALGVSVNLKGALNMTSDQIDKASDAYRKFFTHQNGTSLVCYHGPLEHHLNKQSRVEVLLSNVNNIKQLPLNNWSFHHNRTHCSFHNKFKCCDWDDDMTIWPGCVEQCGYVPLSLSQMLTGDAELGMRDYAIQHYGKELKSVGIFLIPHHGSIDNWRKWFKDVHANCVIWVCSAGINRSLHPNKKIVDDLEDNGNHFIGCDESQGLVIKLNLNLISHEKSLIR